MSRIKLYDEANTKLLTCKVNATVYKKVELAAKSFKNFTFSLS